MTQQNNVPNVYQLAGDGIQITYTVSNTHGEAQLDCKVKMFDSDPELFKRSYRKCQVPWQKSNALSSDGRVGVGQKSNTNYPFF